MMHALESFIIRLLIAVLIAVAVYFYFASVLPPAADRIFAGAVGLIELVAPLASKSGGGASLRLIARAGAALLVWPGIAWALTPVVHDTGARLALAAAGASVAGIFAAGQGQGHEHARLAGVLTSVAIPVYALAYALLAGTRAGAAAGCVGVAVAFAVAKIALVWPDRLERLMLVGGGVALVAAVATVLPAVL
jgi:hypothetical protein